MVVTLRHEAFSVLPFKYLACMPLSSRFVQLVQRFDNPGGKSITEGEFCCAGKPASTISNLVPCSSSASLSVLFIRVIENVFMELLPIVGNKRGSQDWLGSRYRPGAMPLHPRIMKRVEAWVRCTDIHRRCVVGAN